MKYKFEMWGSERKLWMDNDQGLYSWWKDSGMKKKDFIKRNKKALDEAICKAMHGMTIAEYEAKNW